MNLHVINTGFFKLDGGAMFGVVPKSIWQKTNPADEQNMCTWAMRCLLIEDGNRLILIDNGIGNKQDAKFFGHFYLHGDASMEKSLKEKGFTPNDISDMFLTHLHFDHCGGSIKHNEDRTKMETAFPNATYWSNAQHWEWATKPNKRERASFLKENILPIQESGQLKFIQDSGIKFQDSKSENEFINSNQLGGNISIMLTRGHTDAMMIPQIKYKDRTIVFMADLLPSVGHIPLPYVMGYDTRPLITLDEKEKFLKTAAQNNYILFFEHDSVNECCTLQETEKGIRLKETFKLEEL